MVSKDSELVPYPHISKKQHIWFTLLLYLWFFLDLCLACILHKRVQQSKTPFPFFASLRWVLWTLVWFIFTRCLSSFEDQKKIQCQRSMWNEKWNLTNNSRNCQEDNRHKYLLWINSWISLALKMSLASWYSPETVKSHQNFWKSGKTYRLKLFFRFFKFLVLKYIWSKEALLRWFIELSLSMISLCLINRLKLWKSLSLVTSQPWTSNQESCFIKNVYCST